jgi:hypothetical protein
VVEISSTGIRDYHGTYEEYVHDCGDDHLDADTVLKKAKREERKEARTPAASGEARPDRGNGSSPVHTSAPSMSPNERRRLEGRREEITAAIEKSESRVAEIDAGFASPGFFGATAPEEVQRLQAERETLLENVEQLMEEWERVEERLGEGVAAG